MTWGGSALPVVWLQKLFDPHKQTNAFVVLRDVDIELMDVFDFPSFRVQYSRVKPTASLLYIIRIHRRLTSVLELLVRIQPPFSCIRKKILTRLFVPVDHSTSQVHVYILMRSLAQWTKNLLDTFIQLLKECQASACIECNKLNVL